MSTIVKFSSTLALCCVFALSACSMRGACGAGAEAHHCGGCKKSCDHPAACGEKKDCNKCDGCKKDMPAGHTCGGKSKAESM